MRLTRLNQIFVSIVLLLLILVSGALGGIVGIMVAIPVYLLLKIIIVRIYNRWEKTVT